MEISNSSNELYPQYGNGKWGYCNEVGDWLIKPRFDAVYAFHDNLAVVKNDSKFGYINMEGEMVLPLIFDDADDFSEDRARVVVNGEVILIDKRGQTVSKGFTDVGPFVNGFAIASDENCNIGFIGKDGKWVIKPKYVRSSDMFEGVAIVFKDNKFGLIDTEGKEILPLVYDDLCQFSHDKLVAGKGDKYGVIDFQGNSMIEPLYDFIGCIKDGMAVMQLGELQGYMNESLATIISPKFETCFSFENGVAVVQESENYKYGVIDKNGEWVVKPTFDEIVRVNDASYKVFAIAAVDGHYGFIANDGQWVVKPVFDEIVRVSPLMLRVCLGGKFGLIDTQLNEIVPPAHDLEFVENLIGD